MAENYIEDLIKGATYQYNGDERDMTKGNYYVIDRVTSDYIELKDDHGQLHQFSRSEYPKFKLASVPRKKNLDNYPPPKRQITDLIQDEKIYFDFMEVVGTHRAKHFSEAIIEKRMYVIDYRQAFEVYEFMVKNNFDVTELLSDHE